MINRLTPRLTCLPQQQKMLWLELDQTPGEFVLYGGTAVALHLGHRASIDFDFFSSVPFDPDTLRQQVDYLRDAETIDIKENTLTCIVDRGGPVQVSFFGGLRLNRIEDPLVAKDNELKIASLLDLAGMKAAVVTKRSSWKDYVDMAAIIKSGVTIEQALGAGKAIYGKQFASVVSLKALGYHEDVSTDSLSEDQRALFDRATSLLSARVKSVNLGGITNYLSKRALAPAREIIR